MTVAYCTSFPLKLLEIIQNDTFKMALYDGDADFDADTLVYTTTNEVVAEGYTAGGVTLTVSSGYPQTESDRPGLRFESPSWTFVDPAQVRWALVYNASRSDVAVLSIDMGQEYRVSGAFEFTIPLSAPPLIQFAFPVVR